ncbi:MAG: hypothetical protein A4E48_00411 [Methanosaeta sp. PtaU1.Bin060]|nr:MAG: hypothetical protein A4E48_00411 [Methanosaeta sp. PtaU1.Bin060]
MSLLSYSERILSTEFVASINIRYQAFFVRSFDFRPITVEYLLILFSRFLLYSFNPSKIASLCIISQAKVNRLFTNPDSFSIYPIFSKNRRKMLKRWRRRKLNFRGFSAIDWIVKNRFERVEYRNMLNGCFLKKFPHLRIFALLICFSRNAIIDKMCVDWMTDFVDLLEHLV